MPGEASHNLPLKGGGRKRQLPGGGRFVSRFSRVREDTTRCRTLRRTMTDAERKLWSILRGRQLAGLSFRRQHPLGPYVADFYCPTLKLVIEVDGGQHASDVGKSPDRKHTTWLQQHGVQVLRYWNNDVLREIESVTRDIAIRVSALTGNDPHPSSPFQGEVK